MYGITIEDKKRIDSNIERQTSFLKEYSFDLGDKMFSLLDTNMNSNISPQRYFAEVNNRVNTLFNYSKIKGYKPVFITLTAPSELHYTGKKGLYCPYSKDKLFDYGDGLKSINPHDTALFLSKIWAKFLRLSVFKKLKRQIKESMTYLRVYEPHKSGVPHLHAMLFLPQNFIIPLKKIYKQYFATYGISKHGGTDYRYTWHNNAGGAVAYIMKYINKTFKNAKEGIMTDEAYYFAKHRIIRFLTSRTLIPLTVYRRIKHDDDNQDMQKATSDYKSGAIQRLFGDTTIIQVRFCQEEKETYDFLLYQKNFNISNQIYSHKLRYEETPKNWKQKVIPKYIYVNGKKGIYKDEKFYFVDDGQVMNLSDYNLYMYFLELDINNVDLNHYYYIRSELIKIGLLSGEMITLTDSMVYEF